MRWVLLIALALTVSATGASADRYSDCNQHNDLDRRIRGCTRIIERGTRESKDNRIAAYYLRGSAYFNKREYERAIADYTEVIKLKPKFVADAYFNRGNAYFNKGAYDRAIADYTEVVKLKPRYALAYYNRGAAYFNKGEYDRAIADCTEVIKLAPRSADAYALRGWAYEKKGDREKAIADYKKALKIDPSNKIAREGLERLGERIATPSGKRSRKKSTATMAPLAALPEEETFGGFPPSTIQADEGEITLTAPGVARADVGAQKEGAPAPALTEPSSEGFDGKWQLNDLAGTLDIKGNEWRHPEMGIADLLKGRGPTNYEVQYRHHRGVICDYRIKKASDGQRLILEPANPTQPTDFCPSGILLKVGP